MRSGRKLARLMQIAYSLGVNIQGILYITSPVKEGATFVHLPRTTRRRIFLAAAGLLCTGILAWSASLVLLAPKADLAAAVPPDLEIPLLTGELHLSAQGYPLPIPASGGTGADSATPVQPKPIVETYVVQPNDTISGIAAAHGLRMQTLLWSNGLNERSIINIGDELLIPAVDGVLHKVRRADNLWDLAMDYGVDMDEIIRANPEVDPSALQIGQMLLIPGGKPGSAALAAPGAAAAGAAFRLDNWPASGPITDHYGYRIHPVYGSQHLHDGLDLSLASGTPVRAAAGGTVTMNSWFGGYGITIRIDHGGGVVTQYSHLSAVAVSGGQRVAAGDLIGHSGNTGVSTGPHLHFMVIVGGKAVDPMGWLP